jgi:uncharacterized membrane protein YjjP (DUF1212 family)
MKNIIEKILKQQDKLLHFFLSGWLFLVMVNVGVEDGVAFFVTFFIGVFKEIYDQKYRNGAEFGDLLANFLGIIISMLIYNL